MTLRDFRIGWRLLVRQPAYSAVTLAGLALGFAACLLLLAYAGYSLRYDAHIPGADHVYTIKSRFNAVPQPQWMEQAPLVLAAAARHAGLQVDAAGLTTVSVSMRVGGRVRPVDLMLAEPGIVPVFRLVASRGDLAAALSRPDALALTLDTARALFGGGDALGQTVHIHGHPYQVVALLRDPPPNTTVPYAALAGLASNAWPDPALRSATLAGDMWLRLYFRLADRSAAPAALAVLQDAIDRSLLGAGLPTSARALVGRRQVMDLRLGPLRDAYFDPDVRDSFGSGPRGDRGQVLALVAVALLILLMAAINYINLGTVRTLQRQREIGVRKMMGAGTARIVRQFLAESLLAGLVSALAGLLLAYLLLPPFSMAVGRNLDGMMGIATVLAGLAIGAVVGLAAGVYPAWIASRMPAGAALAGLQGQESRHGGWMRRSLTVLQMATAIGLVGVTLVIAIQIGHGARVGPGFDPRPLLVLDLPGPVRDADGTWNPLQRAFRDALLRLPEVAVVATSDEAIGRPALHYVHLKRRGGPATQLVRKQVSRDYFATYGLVALAGRLFEGSRDPDSGATSVVINASAARRLGYASVQAAVGQRLLDDDHPAGMDVIGVAPDLHYQSLREPAQPAVFMLGLAAPVLTVRVAAGAAGAEDRIALLYRQYFPNDSLELHRAADVYARYFADDRQLLYLLLAGSVVAAAIAAFGVYVLAAFNVQRRGREIALRKLCGARGADVVRLLGYEFVALVVVAAAIGLPIAAVVNARYLAAYADPVGAGPWALVAALMLALMIALASTLRHGLAALRIKPALALRD